MACRPGYTARQFCLWEYAGLYAPPEFAATRIPAICCMIKMTSAIYVCPAMSPGGNIAVDSHTVQDENFPLPSRRIWLRNAMPLPAVQLPLTVDCKSLANLLFQNNVFAFECKKFFLNLIKFHYVARAGWPNEIFLLSLKPAPPSDPGSRGVSSGPAFKIVEVSNRRKRQEFAHPGYRSAHKIQGR